MATRIFLDNDKTLPELIASRLLAEYSGKKTLPDPGNVLLTLPGKLARQKVLKHLAGNAENGLLLPQILTPALLMRYGMDEQAHPSGAADELLWLQSVKKALQTPEKFDLIFPDAGLIFQHVSARVANFQV